MPFKREHLPETTLPPEAMANFASSHAAFLKNKHRKQEKWHDWTPAEGDALDQLVSGGSGAKPRRPQEAAPYGVRERAYTPVNRRFEMTVDPDQSFDFYLQNQKRAEEVKSVQYKKTSIFGGQQQVQGRPGLGWRADFGYVAPPPAETTRNAIAEKKYTGSSFPGKYDTFCDQEYQRMRNKARGL
jgi:hypothetical protein